jgi:TonB-dependent starch-binding outer membrane protein SusC
MKRILLMTMVIPCLLLTKVWAQDRVVTGRVTAIEDRSTLPGVNVQVKGSQTGTTTSSDGTYSLNVPNDATLVFSFIGLLTQEVAVGNRTVVDVAMATDTKQLGEVVVVGYGSQLKRELTGNIARIKPQEIQDIPMTSFDQVIQGKAAGVQVNSGTGKLGQAPQIRIRGQSSVSASNQPLYVIDGIPATQNDLSFTGLSSGSQTNPLIDINPQDIESIDILKDASAAAIYGARAANGVVLITTKKGKQGRTNVNFGAQFGSSAPTRKVKFLNSQQYVDFYRIAAANSDRIDEIPVDDPDSYTSYMESFFEGASLGTFGTPQQADTDWGSLSFQDAPMSQYDLNISGGNEKTTFYVSGQYLDQKGILIGNALNRMTGRVNLDHKVSDRFRFGFNMGLTRTFNERISGDRQFDNPMQMVALTPLSPSIDPETGLPIGTPPGNIEQPAYYNPLINIGNAYFNTTVHRNISSVYGQLEIIKGLSFRSEIALDLLNQQEELYYNSKTQRNFGAPQGLGQNRFVRVENYNLNNYFNYVNTIGVVDLTATAGMSYQQSQTKTNYVEGQDFPSDAYRMISSAARKTDGSSTQTDFRFLSYFLRANFKLWNRFLLGASARVDGSTRFGASNRYGFFPAASAGWILTEEQFLKDKSGLSFLKLRASYGRTGNAEIQNFAQLGLFSGDAGYGGLAGQRPSQFANPDLRWETTDQVDVGFDFGFLKDRITGEIDYYEKRTSGLLLDVNIPGTTGRATQFRNVGKLNNKGFEFVLNTDNFVGDFKWRTSLNLATNQNKILDLQGQIIEGGLNSMSRAVEGQPLGVYFTAEYAGVDPSNGDALWYRNSTDANGVIDRSTTNNYTEAQRVVVGSPLPKWIGGVTNTFSYKGLELSVFFSGSFGNKINFYGVGRFSSANGRFEDNQTVDQLAAWTPDNPNTNVPEARLFFNNGAQPSSRFILDGSFVRLRNVTLAYNLPKQILSPAKINSCRIFVTGLNLLTFTDYAGWDPEVNADDVVSNIAIGYDFYTAPQPRIITAGINLGF